MEKKVKSEKESREELIGWARRFGCEADLLKIFARYDELLKTCKTKEERQAIQAMGVLEVNAFFTGNLNDGRTLTIDGKQIK
jgi:hypothetical protein